MIWLHNMTWYAGLCLPSLQRKKKRGRFHSCHAGVPEKFGQVESSLKWSFLEAYLHLASRLSQIMATATPDAGAPSLAMAYSWDGENCFKAGQGSLGVKAKPRATGWWFQYHVSYQSCFSCFSVIMLGMVNGGPLESGAMDPTWPNHCTKGSLDGTCLVIFHWKLDHI